MLFGAEVKVMYHLDRVSIDPRLHHKHSPLRLEFHTVAGEETVQKLGTRVLMMGANRFDNWN